MQSQRERAREEFCRSMREFIQDYGIQSDGHLRRKEEQRKTMEEVRRNEGTLKTGNILYCFLVSLQKQKAYVKGDNKINVCAN